MKNIFLLLTSVLSFFILTKNNYNIQAVAFTGITGREIATKSNNFSLPANDTLPLFNKIVVVIGENTKASSVTGNRRDAPYINSLIKNGANFTQSYALFHPSQPNYLALFSGSDQGVSDDATPSKHFTTPNLARELLNAGKNFICYSEDLPAVGYNGNSSGLYVRRHNPVANWMGTGKNQVPATTNQPFTAFPSDFSLLPDVSFIIPNLCSGGHNPCEPYKNKILQFDKWLQKYLDAYKNWCLNHNSLLIITYDEDDYTGSNRILTVFYGSHVIPGNYRKEINAYNILRTIEDGMGLTVHAGNAEKAKPITYCWSRQPYQLN